jgi:glycosyltransferase involved in cell wall biosynthesis
VNVVIVNFLSMSASSGAATRIKAISEGMDSLGAPVRVVTAAAPPDEGDSQVSRWLNLGRTAWDVRRNTLKLIAEERPDVVYIRSYPGAYPLLARRLCAKRIPFVVEVHTVGPSEYIATGNALRGRVYARLEHPLLARAAGIVAVTDELRQRALEVAGRDVPSIALGNGMDTLITPLRSRAETRRQMGVREDASVIVMAGFTSPWHGVDRALQMVRALPPDFGELWLIGAHSAGDRSHICEEAARLGLERSVRVFPWMEERETATLVAAADLGLGPLALDRKGLVEAAPLKIRFYLSLGIRVLVNYVDSGLHPDDSFAMHVDSADAGELATGVTRLLSRAPVGAQAQRAAAERFSWQTVCQSIMRFLSHVVGDPQPGTSGE